MGAFRQVIKKKGINKLYYGHIPAVENYLAMFKPPDAETLQCRLSMQEKATEEAASVIIEQRVNNVPVFRPFSAFVSFLFFIGIKIFYKYYRVSNDCDGCGICEKTCPVSAVTMENKRPVFSAKCEHCFGCINLCPLNAIQFGRKKFGRPGYKHPGIDIRELYCRG